MTENALKLADQAERGSTHAAFELSLLIYAESVTELAEFVAPTGQLTGPAFDALADGFNFAQYVKQHKEASREG